MREIRFLCAVLALALALSVTAGAAAAPFSIGVSRSGASTRKSSLVSVGAGEVFDFSARDLELRMGIPAGSLEGVTVTALPDLRLGSFFLDGVELEAYEFMGREELDRLCFAAGELTGTAVTEFMPRVDGVGGISLSIRVMERSNTPPALEGASVLTGRNVTAHGHLSAVDPDGDSIKLQLIKPPEKGAVSLSGLSFLYEPYHNKTGADSFTLCAVDEYGAYSGEAVVSVDIDKQKRDFYYTDMVSHPSQYAALMLHENDIYTGQRMGTSYFFEPGALMNRGEFLMLLITASGFAKTMTPTVNTGLPGDEEIPSYLKRYVKKAVEEKIISPELPFYWNEVPSRAETVVLTSRAARITDVKSYPLDMEDAGKIPDWAVPAYRNLAAYRMLDLYDGLARPEAALTNAYAADLCWQLYKHTHR